MLYSTKRLPVLPGLRAFFANSAFMKERYAAVAEDFALGGL